MSEHFLRVYKKFDVKNIKSCLLIIGDLSASCASCNEINLKIDVTHCPACQAEFKFVAFRNVRTNFPKIHKILDAHPDWNVVDFDDYQRIIGAMKAGELFK